MAKNKTTDRANVSFDLGDPNVQAQVQPKETFVAPGLMSIGKPIGQGDNLKALAKALGGAREKLSEVDARNIEAMKRDQLAKAQTAYLQNKKGFKAAVDAGEIKPGENPHFNKYYKQLELKDVAQSWSRQFQLDMLDGKLWESDDPEAFKKAKDESLSEFMPKIQGQHDDLDIAQALIPAIQKEEQKLQSIYMKEQEKHIRYKGEVAFQNDTTNYIESALEQTPESMAELMGEEEVRELSDSEIRERIAIGLSKKLNDSEEGAIANGLPGGRANQLLAHSIINIAKEREDPNILKILEAVTGAKATGGAPIAKTVAIAEKLTAAREWITNRTFRKMQIQWSLDDRPEKLKILQSKVALIPKIAQKTDLGIKISEAKLDALDDKEASETLAATFIYKLLTEPGSEHNRGPGEWMNPAMRKKMLELDPDLPNKILGEVKSILTNNRFIVDNKHFHSARDKREEYLRLEKLFQDKPDGYNYGEVQSSFVRGLLDKTDLPHFLTLNKNSKAYQHAIFKTDNWSSIETILTKPFSDLSDEKEVIMTGLGAMNAETLKIKARATAWQMIIDEGKKTEGGYEFVDTQKIIKQMQEWAATNLTDSLEVGGVGGALPGDTPLDTKKTQLKNALEPQPDEDPYKGFGPELHQSFTSKTNDVVAMIDQLDTPENAELFKGTTGVNKFAGETSITLGTKTIDLLRKQAEEAIVPGDIKTTQKKLTALADNIKQVQSTVQNTKALNEQKRLDDLAKKNATDAFEKKKAQLKEQTSANSLKEAESALDARSSGEELTSLATEHNKQIFKEATKGLIDFDSVVEIITRPNTGIEKWEDQERLEFFQEVAGKLGIPNKAWLIESIYKNNIGK